MFGHYCMKLYVKTDKKLRSMEKQVVSNYMLHIYLCKFVPFFYLTTNMKGTLGGFFYHLFSVIYTFLFFAVRFVVTFERLAKTFQFLKMIHGGYLRSYFDLF